LVREDSARLSKIDGGTRTTQPPIAKGDSKLKMLVHYTLALGFYYTLRASIYYLVCSAGEPHNILAYRTEGSLAPSPLQLIMIITMQQGKCCCLLPCVSLPIVKIAEMFYIIRKR